MPHVESFLEAGHAANHMLQSFQMSLVVSLRYFTLSSRLTLRLSLSSVRKMASVADVKSSLRSQPFIDGTFQTAESTFDVSTMWNNFLIVILLLCRLGVAAQTPAWGNSPLSCCETWSGRLLSTFRIMPGGKVEMSHSPTRDRATKGTFDILLLLLSSFLRLAVGWLPG